MRVDWPLRVLIGCEQSGAVREAFAALGWVAVSADLRPTEKPARVTHYPSGESVWEPASTSGKGQHYQGDVRDLFSWHHPVNEARHWDRLGSPSAVMHGIPPLWDLAILHPPCDHLSYAGARWFKLKDASRGGDGRMQEGAAFFMEMVSAPSPLVAVENPHSVMQKLYRPSDQVVEPFWFGDPRKKKIHLWLKGLPPLAADHLVDPTGRVTTGGGSWRTDGGKTVSDEDSEGRSMRAIVRSRTPKGFARAMAEQWGAFAEDYYYNNRWLPSWAQPG